MDDDRKAFEAWLRDRCEYAVLERRADDEYRSPNTRERWASWLAATAAERERAAKVCDVLADELWENKCASLALKEPGCAAIASAAAAKAAALIRKGPQ